MEVYRVEKDGQKIWGKILSSIKTQLSSSSFKTWFAGSFVVDSKQKEGSGVLIVGLKNNFLKEQVENRYTPMITKIKNQRGFKALEIVFVVGSRNGQLKTDDRPLFTGVAPQYLQGLRRVDALNPVHNFNNFVVGASNNIAYLCSKQAGENPGQVYNPLFIWGPTGVGKTHLLHAVGNLVCETVQNAKVLYVTSEKFTNDYIESISNRTNAAFRQKYRNVDLLLVDDAQFFGGKESTQDEFFHCFNELQLTGRQVVMTSDRHPGEIPKLKERLLSRFMGGMMADIGFPDVELKSAIVKQKCKEKGVFLEDGVVFKIANSSHGGIRELEGMLLAVLTKQKLSPGEIDDDFIRSIVEGSSKVNGINVSASDVCAAVSRHFKVGEALIRGKSRKAKVVMARQVLMYLLRRDLGLSFEAIGGVVGGRDHSTIIYGVEKMEKVIVNNSSIKDEVLRIKSLVRD